MSRPGSRDKVGSRTLKVRLRKGKDRTVSQKEWLERQLNDPYVREARKLGYRARSAFKLTEIDDKYKLLKPGQVVVDLGAAPGGWSQVAAKRVKSVEGRAVSSPSTCTAWIRFRASPFSRRTFWRRTRRNC